MLTLMKLMAVLVAAITASMVLSNAAVADPSNQAAATAGVGPTDMLGWGEWVGRQIPVAGLFVVVFAWGLTKVMKHSAEQSALGMKFLDKQQAGFAKCVEGLTEAITGLKIQTARHTVTLLIHDAQVRGVNPNTLGSHDDMMKKVLETK